MILKILNFHFKMLSNFKRRVCIVSERINRFNNPGVARAFQEEVDLTNLE